jgi:hypothetical protein
MARRRPIDNSNPRQLTLDEWAETIGAERVANEASPRRASTRAASAPGRAARGGRTAKERLGATTGQANGQAPAAVKLLEMPGALLTRSHLRQLGLERRAVDAIFRALPVVALPGYSRPMIRVEQYRELVERNTFCDDRVRPMTRSPTHA